MRAHELNGRVRRQRCDALRDNEVPMVIEKTTEILSALPCQCIVGNA